MGGVLLWTIVSDAQDLLRTKPVKNHVLDREETTETPSLAEKRLSEHLRKYSISSG